MSSVDGPGAARHALAEGAPPDLLLCDVYMPDGDGPELVRELRDRSPELRALFVSGYAAGTRARRLEAPLLRKPFTRAQLLDAVAGALG